MIPVGTRVYVIAESAPACRAGVVQTVYGTRGYTVLHDKGEDCSDLFESMSDKRDWNWSPSEVVPFTVFGGVVEAHCGDASAALRYLREKS